MNKLQMITIVPLELVPLLGKTESSLLLEPNFDFLD